jgi:hypothetical protein
MFARSDDAQLEVAYSPGHLILTKSLNPSFFAARSSGSTLLTLVQSKRALLPAVFPEHTLSFMVEAYRLSVTVPIVRPAKALRFEIAIDIPDSNGRRKAFSAKVRYRRREISPAITRRRMPAKTKL